jgi:hypothetical protein
VRTLAFYVVKRSLFSSKTHRTFDTLPEFVAFFKHRDRRNSVFWAHNLKGYDGRLLYDFLTKEASHREVPKKMIWHGSKLMTMKVGSVTFRDSLLHLSTKLDEMPEMFGIDAPDMKKQFFPYEFNTLENQEYVGPLPPVDKYPTDFMTTERRALFFRWHAEESRRVGNNWNLREVLKTYCVSDVDILTRCLEAYHTLGMTVNKLDPLGSPTIASYAMRVYRTNHLKHDTIPILTAEEASFARRAMRGGRTDVRQMYRQFSPEQIRAGIGARYLDVQSLYPAVQYYDVMPVGVPIIRKFEREHEFQPPSPEILELLHTFTGFAEVDISPTRYLHHPVLACKDETTGKLEANLITKFKQVFTSVEIQEALEQGYVIHW